MPEKLNPNEALSNLKEKYPDYNFDKFEFKSANTASIVLCREHGEVLRSYKDLRRTSTACPKCAENVKLTKEDFISEVTGLITGIGAESINKYDFSSVNYKNALTNVTIICKVHGNFSIRPYSVKSKLKKGGLLCTFCSLRRRTQLQKYDLDNFLSVIPEEFKMLDTFEKSIYTASKEEITITCKEHGDYKTLPNWYLSGRRCPRCSSSKKSFPEFELFDFIKSIYPKAESRKRFEIDGHKLEFDIYIPEKRLAIEYNGLVYHRKLTELDHINLPTAKYSLRMKSELAKLAGIRLIHIFEDEWLDKQKIVEKRLKSILGADEKIHARKCEVKEISYTISSEFLILNHLQGNTVSSYSFGLFHESELVAVMTFGKARFLKASNNWDYELLRFASSKTVVGGFSKLLKVFVDKHKPQGLHSYSDRRWSLGNVYEKNGFKLLYSTASGYFWCKNQQRYNRMNHTKIILAEKFGQNKTRGKTESQIMYEQGYFKVEDCGQDLWAYKP